MIKTDFTLAELNDGLRLVEIKFKNGDRMTRKWTVRNNAGFIAFADDYKWSNLPYIPVGGIKALEEIVSAGGFCGTENMIIFTDDRIKEI